MARALHSDDESVCAPTMAGAPARGVAPIMPRSRANLPRLKLDELKALTAHFDCKRMGLGMEINPPEIAATLFALSQGWMLRADLAPEVAAARFVILLRRLTGLDPPP
jgi:hypothetical protein